MYVLVLGLDVLGNPFGFFRDLSEGVEAFFYEPYQVITTMSNLRCNFCKHLVLHIDIMDF